MVLRASAGFSCGGLENDRVVLWVVAGRWQMGRWIVRLLHQFLPDGAIVHMGTPEILERNFLLPRWQMETALRLLIPCSLICRENFEGGQTVRVHIEDRAGLGPC